MNQSCNVILSPTHQDLSLTLLVSTEGLTESTDCELYIGQMTMQHLVDNFECEENKDGEHEHDKMQRNVEKSRTTPIIKYLTTRSDYSLPCLSLVVNRIQVTEVHHIGQQKIVSAIIESGAHRYIVDGQGRRFSIGEALKELPELATHGVGFKMVVTNTKTIVEAKQIIRQIFNDYNGNLKKPSTSLSLYFDSSKPYPRMLNKLIDLELDNGKPLYLYLSKQGKPTRGQIWTYTQFSSFVLTLFKTTQSELNEALKNDLVFENMLDVASKFIKTIFNQLPLSSLDCQDWNRMYKESLFTKALFAKGLALFCQCLIDEAADHKKEVEWDKLKQLKSLPLYDFKDEFWVKSGVSESHDKTTRIVRGCENRIARVLCFKLGVRPNLEI